MPHPYKDPIPFFFGRDPDDGGELEDPIKFIEKVKSTIYLRRHTDEIKRPISIGVIFRLHLRGNASLWHRNLSPHIRANWNDLEAAFLSRFKIQPDKIMDPDRFFKLLFNLKQNGRTISEYIKEADQLNSQCPIIFRRSLVPTFITGLDEAKKISLVLAYLRSLRIKTEVSYEQAKDAVIKAHQFLERQNPSNSVRNYLPPKPSYLVTQSALLLSPHGSEELPSLEPRDNAPYQPLNTSQIKTVRIQADHGIYCNHCREEGHDSVSCTKLVASSAQRETSRVSINKLQNVPRQLPLSQYIPSHNQAQLRPQSLDQAHYYPQSFKQTHQYPRSLNQVRQPPQSPNQAQQYPPSLFKAYQYPQSLQQDHQYSQSPSRAPQSLNQAHKYPQSLYQACQYPPSLHQDPQTLHQDQKYPQSPQYPQSPSQEGLNKPPQSLHQDPQTLHLYQKHPQSPDQPPQGLYQAYQFSQSPSPYQAYQYSQSLNQAHQYPLSPNQVHYYP